MSDAGERWKRLDLPVWTALAVMLVLGCGLIRSVEARTITFSDPQGSLHIRYPAGWLATPGSTSLLDVQNPLSGAPAPTRLVVVREARAAGSAPAQVSDETVLARSLQLAMYRALGAWALQVSGRDALAIEYAFVADPHQGVLTAERLPIVMRGVEIMVFVDGTVYHIDFRAAAGWFDRARPVLDRILREIEFSAGGRP